MMGFSPDTTAPYEPPAVIDLGTLAELTQGGGGNQGDGGTASNV